MSGMTTGVRYKPPPHPPGGTTQGQGRKRQEEEEEEGGGGGDRGPSLILSVVAEWGWLELGWIL